jgi:5-methylcytosine-specific restriction endonuclease McrBC GTP-binding regulatory subunit McrB
LICGSDIPVATGRGKNAPPTRYSGEEFGVPANLLIIGTMNTADRSIALPLGSKFEIPRKLGMIIIGEVAGVPLGQVLTALNQKLEAYLDRDHQIGHSYLMNLATVADFRFTQARDYACATNCRRTNGRMPRWR